MKCVALFFAVALTAAGCKPGSPPTSATPVPAASSSFATFVDDYFDAGFTFRPSAGTEYRSRTGADLKGFHDAFVAQGGLPIALFRGILFRPAETGAR